MQIKIEANEVHAAVLRSIEETMGDGVTVTSIRFVRERQGSVYAEANITWGPDAILGAPVPEQKPAAKTQTGRKTAAKKPTPKP